ncbi:MAG TPA: FlgD immunoglobulin-like domain containing protein [bacterium]
MRKLLLAIFQIAAGFLVVDKTFAQADQFDLSPPGNLEAKSPGDTVVVPLTLSNTAGVPIDAFGLSFFYPNDKLVFLTVADSGTLSEDWLFVGGQENAAGKITIGGANTTPTTASGVLIKVMFKTTGTPGTDSLRLREFVSDIRTATTTDGALNPLPADVRSPLLSPLGFTLFQNYPNPFNPETRIRFDVPDVLGGKLRVQLSVYNLSGQLVRTLVDDDRAPGLHEVDWDGRNHEGMVLPSGVYFYTVRAGQFQETKKMSFVR